MKIRLGFVSNSSSSSFVCNYHDSGQYNFKFDKKQVEKQLKIILKCARDLGLRSKQCKFKSVFGEIRPATEDDIKTLNGGWDANIQYHKDMFLINSRYDNSIPYQFFDLIEDLFFAKRIHLG